MDLRFSKEETAFRQELRDFFRAEIPTSIRTKVMENRHLEKEELVKSHKILHRQAFGVQDFVRLDQLLLFQVPIFHHLRADGGRDLGAKEIAQFLAKSGLFLAEAQVHGDLSS